MSGANRRKKKKKKDKKRLNPTPAPSSATRSSISTSKTTTTTNASNSVSTIQEEELEGDQIVVFDIGSMRSKAGCANELMHDFPTLLGRPRRVPGAVQLGRSTTWVGDEAFNRHGYPVFTYPVQRGIVNNWDEMEIILHHCFYSMARRAPEESLLMLSEQPLNHREHREKSAEILFETLNLAGLCIANQAVLAMNASSSDRNLDTGLVLESGDGVTHAVPVYRGRAIKEATLRLEIGGSDLTKHLEHLLRARNIEDLDLLDMVSTKQKYGYVALDYEDHLREPQRSRRVMPPIYRDNPVEISVERFQCAEPLFRPSLMGLEERGVHELVYDAIMKCDVGNLAGVASSEDSTDDIRSKLLSNIVISGGNTMFSGFTNRLERELKALIENDNSSRALPTNFNLIAAISRETLVWEGGAQISTTLTDDQWCSKDEYDEVGYAVVHSKCI